MTDIYPVVVFFVVNLRSMNASRVIGRSSHTLHQAT